MGISITNTKGNWLWFLVHSSIVLIHLFI